MFRLKPTYDKAVRSQKDEGKEPSKLLSFKSRYVKAVSPPRDEGKEPSK
jgi:hypothetical protein